MNPLANHCHTCGRCVKLCPTGAIAPGREDFRIGLCRSHLTMEKKGELNDLESRLIGDWIFGCDICSSCCPVSSMPPPFPADISWILNAEESAIKSLIKGTALEYAGAKRLRRNAAAVRRSREFAGPR